MPPEAEVANGLGLRSHLIVRQGDRGGKKVGKGVLLLSGKEELIQVILL